MKQIHIYKRCPKTGRISLSTSNTSKTAAILLGLASLIWLLIRVIPKPSRINYPCMKASMPIAFSFTVFLIAQVISLWIFKKGYRFAQLRIYGFAIILFVGGITLYFASIIIRPAIVRANNSTIALFADPLGPNQPIGEAKGVMPGRVVWVYNADATNENCTNSNLADAYFLEKNCDQDIVDQMFSDGIKELTGKTTNTEAWDTIFRYFNINHGKGDVGYASDETIFIKINAVTAWSGAAPDGEMPPDTYIEFDTSPHTIMSILRQLVNEAGVPQENIYIGDPIADIWNTLYNRFHAEFPTINYVSKRNITGRYKLTASSEIGIYYSDHGTVMDQITNHHFFNEMMNADYLINIPSMKGHQWAGITLCAKNHFGSNTTDGSWQLHKGLMKPDNDPLRTGYNKYRVQVDLIADKYLGGNTLLYYVDALWSTSYEHQKPQKFQSAPFNNDWSSSILFSLDPVAIESVCLEILQKEFVVEEIIDGPYDHTAADRFIYVQYDGIDDYLHQAASSEWWPDGITYDPDNSGTPIGSLGVHEHWNNTTDMKYSRNLGTGEGIELIKLFGDHTAISEVEAEKDFAAIVANKRSGLLMAKLSLEQQTDIQIELFDISGHNMGTIYNGRLITGEYNLDLSAELTKIQTKQLYFFRITSRSSAGLYSETITVAM